MLWETEQDAARHHRHPAQAAHNGAPRHSFAFRPCLEHERFLAPLNGIGNLQTVFQYRARVPRWQVRALRHTTTLFRAPVGQADFDRRHGGCLGVDDPHPTDPVRVYGTAGELPVRSPRQARPPLRRGVDPVRDFHGPAQMGSRRFDTGLFGRWVTWRCMRIGR